MYACILVSMFPYNHVFLYPCINVSMSLCIQISMYPYIDQHKIGQVAYPCPVTICPCIYVFVYPCSHIFMFTCIHLFMNPCPHVSMYKCINVSMYPCIHVSSNTSLAKLPLSTLCPVNNSPLWLLSLQCKTVKYSKVQYSTVPHYPCQANLPKNPSRRRTNWSG